MNFKQDKGIAAIPTRYKGYHFRSRLEARWAVFFDALGIEYRYEPEGYQIENGTRYLPDFYLPKFETWCEVKPSNKKLSEDVYKLAEMLDFDSPIPGITDSGYGENRYSGRGLILLGDIPEPIRGNIWHPIIKHHKGLWQFFARFVDGDYLDIEDFCLSSVRDTWGQGEKDWSVDVFKQETKNTICGEEVYNAYLKARSARFEYGESGAT